MRIACSVMAVIFLLIAEFSLAQEDQNSFVGSVKNVKGYSYIMRGENCFRAETGHKVFRNDRIGTGDDGSMGLIFRDDTVLSLGPNSEVVIDEFVFSPADNKFAFVTRMLRGAVSYLSGKISKLSPGSARVETPVATIGIRGTYFLVKLDGPSDDSPKLIGFPPDN